jgi:hypothetical protein
VVFAALRAFCWRPRAWPPFLAAALRLAADVRELEDDERELADERLLPERLDPLDFLEPPLLRRSAICFPSWSCGLVI